VVALAAVLVVATALLISALAGTAGDAALDLLLLGLVLLVVLPVLGQLIMRAARGWGGVRRRMSVRRARLAFRSALRAARRHPEFVDVKRLRAAAMMLRHLHEGVVATPNVPEICEAVDHPYAPIRDAARLVIEAPGASASPRTPSGS
jgi:hypothetical protein